MEIFTNNCKNRDKDGFCSKCGCTCPNKLRVNENNENNSPCDMASYETENN